ncbi:MAG: hypothetical protein N3A69_04665 [Leptospiraceae bacterium]|nr:hypothetical protein [Leptospiraceae bacterium]
MRQKELLPELRLPEFAKDGERIVKKLGEVCENIPSTLSLNELQIQKKWSYPIYGTNGLQEFTQTYQHAEQEKIAACLSSTDELIRLETKKLELYKQHKKGLLQRLFTQTT